MVYLEKIGLLAHCLIIPAVWGLTVEWVFHYFRTRGKSGKAKPAALPLAEPLGWSCQL